MARRNVFDQISSQVSAEKEPLKKFVAPPTAALRGLAIDRLDNKDVMRLIDPDRIIDDGLKDRLPYSDDEIKELAESIKNNKQLVPIVVRRHQQDANMYHIVAGRRRLAAARMLGVQVKAYIEDIDAKKATIYQAIENAHRKDLSLIEQALFAADMAKSGIDRADIAAALNTHHTNISRLLVIINEIPYDLISLIGAAPSVGRPKLQLLANLCKAVEPEMLDLVKSSQELLLAKDPDKRFNICLSMLQQLTQEQGHVVLAQKTNISVKHDGEQIAVIETTKSGKELRIKTDPDFAAWLTENMGDALVSLRAAWTTATTKRKE